MSDDLQPSQLPAAPIDDKAAPPTGPITLQLTRADKPGPTIKRIWITVNSIIAIHPSSPGTPVGTAVWVAQQQAFLVSESVDQILYLMGARVFSITGKDLEEVEARVTTTQEA